MGSRGEKRFKVSPCQGNKRRWNGLREVYYGMIRLLLARTSGSGKEEYKGNSKRKRGTYKRNWRRRGV